LTARRSFDVAVVGAGIVGLAHALAAARTGAQVVVLDRDARANGASVRNFGYVTVTGQSAADTWRRAQLSRDVWDEIAPRAGIAIQHHATAAVARTPEALAVLEEFMRGPMGGGCELLDAAALRARLSMANAGVLGALWSPFERRIEAREAIPLLASHLENAYGVTFVRNTQVQAVAPPVLETTAGEFCAARIVVCPGNDALTLYPQTLAAHRIKSCKLQMLRLAPQPSGWRLPCAVMGDLSFVRYGGFSDCSAAAALQARLAREAADRLAAGVHVLLVQSADGSLVVGDSHDYSDTPDPFAPAAIERMILDEALRLIDIPDTRVIERWTGVYPSAQSPVIIESPHRDVRVVVIASGTGMSTAFAVAEEVMATLAAPGDGDR
jgi:FAD dependent oxidoreductase TIGR03364